MIEIIKDAQTYEFNSMRYLDIEEIQINSEEEIIIKRSDAIFIINKHNNDYNVLWAARSREAFSC